MGTGADVINGGDGVYYAWGGGGADTFHYQRHSPGSDGDPGLQRWRRQGRLKLFGNLSAFLCGRAGGLVLFAGD